MLSAPLVSADPARALLPQILGDEIAFRSALLASVRDLEQVIREALQMKAYDPDKTSLQALIREHRETIKLSLAIVESSKHIDPGTAGTKQVAGLIGRAGILQAELERRGIIDERGKFTERARALLPAATTAKGGV